MVGCDNACGPQITNIENKHFSLWMFKYYVHGIIFAIPINQ
jgi:hypothetical protein